MQTLARKHEERSVYVAEHLRKVFFFGGRSIEAVKNVNLTIDPGEFVVIVGHSGSGKSTLLSLLGGLDAPTSGSLRFLGQDMRQLNEDERALLRRQNVGYVFQFFNLIDFLPAFENVALPLRLQRKNDKLVQERVTSLLTEVGLQDRMFHRPATLSGGEQQRVAIARALVISPQIVLADEPTGNLDTDTGREIVNLMKKLNQEHKQTFIIVTHDLSIADIGTKVIHMKDGAIQRVVEQSGR